MVPVIELKQHLRVTHALDDAYIAELEAAAVAAIEEVEGAYYGEPGAITEYLKGTGTRELFLIAEPAETPAIVVVERAFPGDAGTELEASEFEVRGIRLVRTGAGNTWRRGYEYHAAYTTGYAESQAPYRLQQAVRLLVAHWYGNRSAVSSRIATKLPLGVMSLLRPRQRVS